MKLPPFIGMAFNQFLLGICPWLCSGGHPLQHSLHLPTSYYPIPFNGFPPSLPSLHKYNQPCQERQNHLLSSSIVSDWLCRATIAPSIPPRVFELHWSWLDARKTSPILPIPALWPHSVPTHLYITLVHLCQGDCCPKPLNKDRRHGGIKIYFYHQKTKQIHTSLYDKTVPFRAELGWKEHQDQFKCSHNA